MNRGANASRRPPTLTPGTPEVRAPRERNVGRVIGGRTPGGQSLFRPGRRGAWHRARAFCPRKAAKAEPAAVTSVAEPSRHAFRFARPPRASLTENLRVWDSGAREAFQSLRPMII